MELAGPRSFQEMPEHSLLYEAVSHRGKLLMPPTAKLSDEDIKTLKTWISQGAHWSTNPGRSQSFRTGMVVFPSARAARGP